MSKKLATAHFSLPFLNGLIRIDATDTGQGFALLEMNMNPLSGPETHIHVNEDEYFYVLEGTYEFRCGEELFTCGPGDVVKVPRGEPHRLTAGPAGGRHLTMFHPAGPEGWFVEADSLAASGALTPEAAGLLFDKYGMIRPG
ncbi:cupin domain-containing protein [Actinophytocola xanthii]|uniref:cupin domain-containing protein n=1 Tax=Actinophytocola xanthii TaxID=1912961 RepID=UPI0009FA6136|nr:cupin domain-containing protein [Actinophytocola xanthii]